MEYILYVFGMYVCITLKRCQHALAKHNRPLQKKLKTECRRKDNAINSIVNRGVEEFVYKKNNNELGKTSFLHCLPRS